MSTYAYVKDPIMRNILIERNFPYQRFRLLEGTEESFIIIEDREAVQNEGVVLFSLDDYANSQLLTKAGAVPIDIYTTVPPAQFVQHNPKGHVRPALPCLVAKDGTQVWRLVRTEF